MKYIRKFANEPAYNGAEKIFPGVSECTAESIVKYDPLFQGNVIKYASSTKLTETTDPNAAGFHTNVFGANMASHQFDNGKGLIVFDADITAIGTKAFYGCASITSVEIPQGITTIHANAFQDCVGLTDINLPRNLGSIGEAAFKNSGLIRPKLPASLNAIGAAAFEHCTSLTSIVIPAAVTVIHNDTFQDCSALQIMNLSDSVTSIGSEAFMGCSALQKIYVGVGLTSIGPSAFQNCQSMALLSIKATNVPTLGASAFYQNDCIVYVPGASVGSYRTAWASEIDGERIVANPV